jgi:beta-lactamase regulating signal transducer with metallopeptidase domain
MTSSIAEAVALVARSVELSLALKATLILVLGLAVVSAARRARASRRHLVLAGTFGSVIALPIFMAVTAVMPIDLPTPMARIADAVAPRMPTPAAADVAANGPRAVTPVVAKARLTGMLPLIVRTAWALGALLFAASLTVSLRRLTRIKRDGVPWLDVAPLLRDLTGKAGVRRPVRVVLHEEVAAPLTCGLLSPIIALPSDAAEWPAADVRRALVHEIEHISRGDWAVQLLAHATCALYWFHPLAWRALRALRVEAERACDDAVIHGEAREEYAEQLVSLAQRIKNGSTLPAPAMASRSDLSLRVLALLDANQRRGRAGVPVILTTLVTAGIVVLTVAPGRTVRAAGVAPASLAAASGPRADRRGRALDEALYQAAEEGDVAGITALLDAGANVNAALAGDGSPLIGAARAGRLDAVRLLLDRGAEVDLAVPGDGNALIMAAREGRTAVVDLLLSHGAHIDAIVPEDENALIQASAAGRLAVVQLLVARGADVNARAWAEDSGDNGEGEWRTPLGQATSRGHAAVIAFLRSAGAQQ